VDLKKIKQFESSSWGSITDKNSTSKTEMLKISPNAQPLSQKEKDQRSINQNTGYNKM
jgi:hypothetical protein